MIRIKVPASTANLGSGVDALGMALSRYLTVETYPAQNISFSFNEGFDGAIPDDQNLILTAYLAVFQKAKEQAAPAHFDVCSEIPLSRGMGSSASAIVAGAFVANEALGGRFTTSELIDICTVIEGHPDNIVPCAVGGITVAMPASGEKVAYRSFAPDGNVAVVIVSPEFKLSTELARSVLPEMVPLKTAVVGIQRACFMVASLMSGNYDDLWTAADDPLFTPSRAALVPGFFDVIEGAREGKALCAFMSGAGPSIAALVRKENAQQVSDCMHRGFASKDIVSHSEIIEIDRFGVVIEREM